MNILFLTNAYPDFDDSYRGIFVKKMAILLGKEGYKITVVTPKIYRESRFFEKKDGINVYRFPFFSGNKLLIEHEKVPYLRMVLYYLSGLILTGYVILRWKCNLIHAHWAIPTGLIGVLGGSLLRKPLIVTIHGSDFRIAMGGSALLKKIFLFVCQKARHVTCVSELMKKEIEALGVEGRKMLTFPMGVGETFLEKGWKREVAQKRGPFTIISNRNLQTIYNISQLIRAVPIVLREEPETRFLVAGEGPCRESLEGEVKSLNVDSSVRFLGRVPHEKMPDILAGADIYVSTSLHDGTSVSLLEAMATGAFPIVTNIDANGEWISDSQNGFLVPVGDEAFLAGKIIEAIRNKRLVEQACEKNRKIVAKRACWGANIEKVTDLYRYAL